VLGALVPLLFAAAGEFAGHAVAAAPVGGVGHDSGPYWDAIATDWDHDATSDDWRAHSDAVNGAICKRWWPARAVGRVLKTDLFDEVAGEGLVPTLAARSSSVVAIDRSLEAARAGHRRSGAVAVSADVRHLPFADGTFDVIVSNSTLDHFEDVREIAEAVAEMHRVLVPGGRLILTLDNPANPIVALRNALPFPALRRVGLVPYYVGATLSAPDASVVLARAGLTVKEVTSVMHCPRAVAIATLYATRWLVSPRWSRRLRAGLMAFERLERWPLRHRTGYFVALVADKEPA
jgi:SAM-dependent methyltransferase